MSKTGQTVKVRGGGGEGPWYYAQGGNPTCHIPGCKAGDTLIVWGTHGVGFWSFVNCSVIFATSIVEADTYMYHMVLSVDSDGEADILADLPDIYATIIAHRTAIPAIDGSGGVG
jgi:hypothetical protein